MTTAKELRQYCEQLRNEREEELKCVLNDYFESTFIVCHRPFRAVIGNKKCKPIPIHRNFLAFSEETVLPSIMAVIKEKRCRPISISIMHRDFLALSGETVLNCKIQWPNFSEELRRKELEKLGFIITGNRISISVPPYEKGAKLSFAQEWVKKINTSYSDYCANEKKIANEVYSEFVSELLSTPTKSIKTYDGYTLFCDFKFDCKISSKCTTFIRRLMIRDGIEECYEDGKYKGIKVYNSHPIN